MRVISAAVGLSATIAALVSSACADTFPAPAAPDVDSAPAVTAHVVRDAVRVSSPLQPGGSGCTPGDQRKWQNACGINGEGILWQKCGPDRGWQFWRCTGGGNCKNGTRETRQDSVSCWPDREAVAVRVCVDGDWQGKECYYPCEPGVTRPGSTPCGLNGAGRLRQECVDGVLLDTDQCDDPDACVTDTVIVGGDPCEEEPGLRYLRRCIKGQWFQLKKCAAIPCGGPEADSCAGEEQCLYQGYGQHAGWGCHEPGAFQCGIAKYAIDSAAVCKPGEVCAQRGSDDYMGNPAAWPNHEWVCAPAGHTQCAAPWGSEMVYFVCEPDEVCTQHLDYERKVWNVYCRGPGELMCIGQTEWDFTVCSEGQRCYCNGDEYGLCDEPPRKECWAKWCHTCATDQLCGEGDGSPCLERKLPPGAEPPPTCEESEFFETGLPCGTDGRGEWVLECADPKVDHDIEIPTWGAFCRMPCLEGETEFGNMPCGDRRQGLEVLQCQQGRLRSIGCYIPCVPGKDRPGAPCGPDLAGTTRLTCVDERWTPTSCELPGSAPD